MNERSFQRSQQLPVGIYLLILGGMSIVLAFLRATSGSQIAAAKIFYVTVGVGFIAAFGAGFTVLVLNGLQAARGGTPDRVSSSIALVTVGCIVLAWYLAYVGSLAAFPIGFLGYVVVPLALAARVFRVRERFLRSV